MERSRAKLAAQHATATLRAFTNLSPGDRLAVWLQLSATDRRRFRAVIAAMSTSVSTESGPRSEDSS
jgi:hypothetical protein